MRFTKGHGTGNDFLVVPDPDGELALSDAVIAALCDRRTGIGADGVLRVVLTAAVPEVGHLAGQARWFMDYRNADGSAVEMCGNGIRVFARYLADRGYVATGDVPIATRDGVKVVRAQGDGMYAVDMGGPRFDPPDGVPPGAHFVSMGNPHVVFFRDDLDSAPVDLEGAAIEAAIEGGTNVEFAVVRARDDLTMRVWERGVGETMSCGTGACAVAVAAAHAGLADRSASVSVPGGRLHVDWRPDTVVLTGPAVLVADGDVRDSWLEEIA